MITLDSRLSAAASLCRTGVVSADIGTDHALLACHLSLNGAKEVIAADINEGPLEAAQRTIAQYGVTNVRTVLSNGLEKIDYADDVIICGMGGELIADIISGCRFLSENTRFILQPMTKAEVLRSRLYSAGFEIIEERTAYDSRRAYVVMLAQFTAKCRKIDELFAYTGKVSDCRFLRITAEKLLKNAHRMSLSENCKKDAELLEKTAAMILKKAEEYNDSKASL